MWKKLLEKIGAQSEVSKINVMVSPIFEKLIIRLKHVCIHTVSEATRDDLVKFGAKKPIHVIHNAIEESRYNQSTKTDPLQFIYVGRLLYSKNLEVIIRAINIAKKVNQIQK